MHPTQSPFSPPSVDRPGRVTVFCAEELRPTACCIVDALEVRGYEARLRTGGAARKGLARRRAMGLRVVLSPEELDPDVQTRIVRRLDPDGRDDVLLMPCDTPRQVIDAIEDRLRRRSMPPSRRRTERVFLPHPTLVESSVPLAGSRRLTAGATLAAAAATALLVLSPEMVDRAQSLFGELTADDAEVSTLMMPTEAEPTPQSTARASELTLAATQPTFGAQPLSKRYERFHGASADEMDDSLEDFEEALPEPRPGRSKFSSPPAPPWGELPSDRDFDETLDALITPLPPPALSGPIESYAPPAVEPAPLDPPAVGTPITAPPGITTVAGDMSGLPDAQAVAVVALPVAGSDNGMPHPPHVRDSITLEVEDVLLDAPRPATKVVDNAGSADEIPEARQAKPAPAPTPRSKTADPFASASMVDPVAITAQPRPRTADPFADLP